MSFVPDGRHLGSSEVNIPEFRQFDTPGRLPVRISRFAAQLRELWNAEICKPKCLNLTSFKELAEYNHILSRAGATDNWTFERFAPACAACIGMDLTGAKVDDARLAPYNMRLDVLLSRLARQETPLCGQMRVNTPRCKLKVHWMFVPMNNTGQIITRCMLMVDLQGRTVP